MTVIFKTIVGLWSELMKNNDRATYRANRFYLDKIEHFKAKTPGSGKFGKNIWKFGKNMQNMF